MDELAIVCHLQTNFHGGVFFFAKGQIIVQVPTFCAYTSDALFLFVWCGILFSLKFYNFNIIDSDMLIQSLVAEVSLAFYTLLNIALLLLLRNYIMDREEISTNVTSDQGQMLPGKKELKGDVPLYQSLLELTSRHIKGITGEKVFRGSTAAAMKMFYRNDKELFMSLAKEHEMKLRESVDDELKRIKLLELYMNNASILEQLETKYENKTSKAWRPSGCPDVDHKNDVVAAMESCKSHINILQSDIDEILNVRKKEIQEARERYKKTKDECTSILVKLESFENSLD